jgi:hypothetical protein
MSLAYSRHTRKDGSVQTSYRYRCIHHVRDRSFCPVSQSVNAASAETFLLGQISAILSTDDLALARFARQQRADAERAGSDAEAEAAHIADLEAKRDLLVARVLDEGFEISAADFNATKRRIEQQIAVHRERQTRALERAALSRAGAKRLQAEALGEGPVDTAQWHAFSPARRNEFLRLLFPYGIWVSPSTREGGGASIEARLSVRTSEDAEQSEHRRLGPHDAPAAQVPPSLSE